MNTSPNRVLRRVWDRLVSCMEPGGLTKALLISGAFLASTTADATDFWFSPPGWSGSTTTSITGTSSSVPYAYPTSPSGTTRDKVGSRATAFATTLGEVLGGAYSGSSTNVTLNFIPGVYPVTPILPTSGWLGTTNFSQMTNTVLTIQNGWGVTTNTATVKLQLVADMDPGQANWENTNYNNAWGNRFANLGILNTHSGTSYYDPQYFIPYARFVAQNLIFDCNWDGLGGWTAPSHNGFKTFGLTASGRTGKILNVKVVNAGASGPVPATQDMFSGSEGFPLSVFASDFFQDPFTGSGDPTAWVVDSCEVTDFHSSHGGYAAGITVTPRFPGLSGTDVVVGLKGGESKLDASLQSSYGGATYWFEVLDQSTYKNRRIATVQNCFANLIGSAFGVANGGAVRFEGNVVVNGTGLNSDTGHTRNVEVTNSVFLDVLMGANVGSWSPTSGTAYFQNWKFNGNLIRIDRRSALWDYRNYEYNSDNAALVGRDPSALPLWGTNYICYAFAFGSCNTMDVQTNRVTTRPRAAFFEPNPSDTSSATFTVVYRPNIDPLLHHTVDQTQSEPNTNGLVLSGVAYDFGSYSAMNSSSLLYSNTLAIANGPTDIATNGFFGRVQRVERVTSSGKLTGIKEVALSTPIAGSGGNYTVQGRWTLQPTPADTGHSGTTALAPTNVQFLVQDAASNTVSLSAPSTSGNISTLTLPSSLSDGYYHIVAYVLASGATTFDPTRDAWSETEYLKGTTVRFLTSQDMANDRRPSRGSMVIGRTGVTTNSLTVKIKQLTGIGRDAVYNTDFIVESNGVTNSQNGDSTFSITIPTGSNWITVDLMPIKDSQLEREAAVFYITNNAGSYSIAPSFDWPGFPPQRAAARPDLYSNSEWRFSSSVYFYDGPLWEAVSLNDTPTSNYAFVNGTVGRITDESNPRKFGVFLQTNSSTGVLGYRYGIWNASQPGFFAFGASTTKTNVGTLGINSYGANAGLGDGHPWLFDSSATKSVASLYVAGHTAFAYGIDDNFIPGTGGGWMVGGADNGSSVTLPAVWTYSGGSWIAAPNVITGFGALSGGVAYDVATNGVVVGYAYTNVSGTSYQRAFAHNISGGSYTLASGDSLYCHSSVSGGAGMSKAWSIVHVLSDNTVAGEADAVATTIASGTFTSSFACLWKNAANAPTMLGTLAQGETSAFRDIKGTNSEYLVVGYSDSGADASYHATLYSSYFAYIYANMNPSGTIDLNDPSFVQSATGWRMASAVGVSTTGYITVNGVYGGTQWPVLLVPLTGYDGHLQ